MSLRGGRSFRHSNPNLMRIIYIFLLILLLTSCIPLGDSPTSYPLPPTQIPFYASETPAPFIVPVTDTSSSVFQCKPMNMPFKCFSIRVVYHAQAYPVLSSH